MLQDALALTPWNVEQTLRVTCRSCDLIRQLLPLGLGRVQDATGYCVVKAAVGYLPA